MGSSTDVEFVMLGILKSETNILPGVSVLAPYH